MANKKSVGKTSRYWGVTLLPEKNSHSNWSESREEKPWRVNIITKGGNVSKCFETEREAAIYADCINLERNLGKPLNILKPRP
jgi:hypothetical protein